VRHGEVVIVRSDYAHASCSADRQMKPSGSSVTFEDCPRCAQLTASHFFRIVSKKRLCNLCAYRVEKEAQDLHDSVEDYRLHGGLGWLWNHIFEVAFRTLRSCLRHF
jgi:hypothetical protein